MKILYLIVSLIIFCNTSIAQEKGVVVNTLKGKVINEQSNEPVSYTNIGIEGTLHGTASDEEGNFELKIPTEMENMNIYFSAVGFKNKVFPVNTLFGKEFSIIKIASQSYGIDNVNVAAQNMVLVRILRMASENIPYNFIRGPFNLIGTYKNEKTVNSETTEQSAEVLLYDNTGYAYPSKRDAYHSLKYSLITPETENNYRFSTGVTRMDELLEHDWVRSASSVLNPALTSEFGLKLEDEPNINGESFWVISFRQIEPTLAGSGDYYATRFEGEITINKEDYSVIKIKGKTTAPKSNTQGKALAIASSNSNYLQDVSSEFLIEYTNLKPEKIEINKTYSYKGDEILEKSSLVINQVKATNLTQLDSRQYFTGK